VTKKKSFFKDCHLIHDHPGNVVVSWNEALGGVGNFMHQEVALRPLVLVKKLWSRQTDRQTNWQAGRHKDRKIDKPKDRWT
jgi:hypothetical protein